MRLLLSLIFCSFSISLQAQQEVVDSFHEKAGRYAALFVGKLEHGYPASRYANHPYWDDIRYYSGEVLYKGIWYKDLLMRYDAFLHQLAVMTPDKRMSVLVDMRQVECFVLNGIPFVKENGTYVAELHRGKNLRLIRQTDCRLSTAELRDKASYRKFSRNVSYLLYRDDDVQEVKSKSSLLKLFPRHKKALNQYVKTHSLDFRNDRQAALKLLVAFADELEQKP